MKTDGPTPLQARDERGGEPPDRIHYRSSLVTIGSFRCHPAHAVFPDSGPIVDHCIVFPRTTVEIRHRGAGPFVSTPNQVNLYNRGQEYRRRPIDPSGDRCDWFRIEESSLRAAVEELDPLQAEDPDGPFRFPFGIATSVAYMRQREVVESIRNGMGDRLFVDERVFMILGDVLQATYGLRGIHGRTRGRTSAGQEIVEYAKLRITRQLSDVVKLATIAEDAGVSPFRLCRLFRKWTGQSLYEYRQQLRVRASLEMLVRPGRRLSDLALDLGFTSHSHFTLFFRRIFGCTPSEYRAGSWLRRAARETARGVGAANSRAAPRPRADGRL